MNTKESDCILVKCVNTDKEIIYKTLREKGFRVTEQRKIIIDIIFNYECTSCKEIYFQVSKECKSIGIATVYRVIKSLEEIGVINRKNLYKIANEEVDILSGGASVILKNNKEFNLSEEKWKRIIEAGLYCVEGISASEISSIIINKGVI